MSGKENYCENTAWKSAAVMATLESALRNCGYTHTTGQDKVSDYCERNPHVHLAGLALMTMTRPRAARCMLRRGRSASQNLRTRKS